MGCFYKCNKYQIKKYEIRQEAIDWQASFVDNSYDMQSLFEKQAYFEKLAKRYGLMREFKENGIL